MDDYTPKRNLERVEEQKIYQIQEDLQNPETLSQLKSQAIDEDLPGLAQHYCVECCRYFVDAISLAEHTKSKVHKRRLKELKEEAHTQKHAEAAVGLTTENKRLNVIATASVVEAMDEEMEDDPNAAINELMI